MLTLTPQKCLDCGHEFLGGTGGYILTPATCPRCHSRRIKPL